tara:strand:- start:1810 stop:2091 length:282 start_codon:yes stop_codon:yes gene_type:complete
MIRKGSIVKRVDSDRIFGSSLDPRVLKKLYPPPGEVCIVTTNPKEVDLSSHDRFYNPKSNRIALKKGIEVIYNGRWYGPCDINAFEEVKKHGQ